MTNHANERETILITGSTGLIGSRLIEALTADFRVIGLDIKKPESLPEHAEWMECDLTDDDNVKQVLGKVRERVGSHLASVLHLAAYYDFSGAPSPLYRELTVEGSRRLIHGLRDFQVEQFIFSSSLLVMKPIEKDEGERLTEESPVQAEWHYPRSKLETERLLREEHGPIPLLILRIAGVYNENCRSLPIAHQIQRIREKQLESLFFPGDAEHGQPFLHLDDLVTCFRRAVELRQSLSEEEMLLVAEPEVMSYRELQHTIGELIHDRQWPAIRVPATAAKTVAWTREKLSGEEQFIRPWMIDLADDHYPVEISRAKERLRWEPGHRLQDTLPEMIRRLENNPRKWYELNGLTWPEESEAEGAEQETAGARQE